MSLSDATTHLAVVDEAGSGWSSGNGNCKSQPCALASTTGLITGGLGTMMILRSPRQLAALLTIWIAACSGGGSGGGHSSGPGGANGEAGWAAPGGESTPGQGEAGSSSARELAGSDTPDASGVGGATAGDSSKGGAAGTPRTGGGTDPGGNPEGGPPTDAVARMKCTGTSPVVCHFGGSPGDYAVTAVLGGGAAAQTEVQAEMHRLMLSPVTTSAGMTRRYTFNVNVRTPEGQPVEDGPSEGTPGLDLYFYGSKAPGETPAPGAVVAPLLDSIGYAPAKSPMKVYVAGDSTVCDQTDTDYSGWAQMLPAFLDDPVSVANYADSGESSGSFLRSTKMWGGIHNAIASGDWVIIQFGHNDTEDKGTSFYDNITALVSQAKAKGAKPVLVSPPARATFSGQTLTAQFVYADFTVPTVMRQVSTEQSVPLVDLTTVTTNWYNKLGPSGWQAFHALGKDKTHTNRAGALAIAGFFVDAVRSQNIGLAPYLR